ncbi:MAG: L,D-transpeptidase family protein [Myxococcota bacterium]
MTVGWILTSLLLFAGCSDGGEAADKTLGVDPRELEAARLEAIARAEEARRAHDEAARLAAEAEAARLEAERIAEEQARAEAERRAFEAMYPLQGIAYHFIAQVFAEPNRNKAIGYMRRGSQFRAKAGIRGSGCDESWHEVPGGGFVCRGNGYLIGEEPQSFDPSPAPPALDDALPYSYAYTVVDTRPQYWRLPTLAEEAEAQDAIAELRRRERVEAEPEPTSEAPPEELGAESEDDPPPTDAPDAGTDASPPENEESPSEAIEAPEPPGQEEEVGTPETEPQEEDGVELPEHLRLRMRQGFYVSVDGRESTELGRLFYRTVRGGYVRHSDVVDNDPPASEGVSLGTDWNLPLAIVFRRGVDRYRRDATSGRLVGRGAIDRHAVLPLADDNVVVDGRRYVMSRRGTIVREPSVRIIRQRGLPDGVPATAKWIHVDLARQSLVAYEGETPVYATLISSGKEGHETPTGLYRIQSKHVSTTMDDLAAEDGAYSIEDVPWTMYFYGNYALHGAFWHYTFGRPRSHGCVNLAPADARWLFHWSSPGLPAAWHGMFADGRERRGTFVFITD